jgi:hypothetical protein
MNTPIADACRKTLRELHDNRPIVVRMHPSQQAAMDLEGMTGVEVIKSTEPGPLDTLLFPKRTLGGIPVELDVSAPEDSIIFEGKDGEELSRITGLSVPTPYSEESK